MIDRIRQGVSSIIVGELSASRDFESANPGITFLLTNGVDTVSVVFEHEDGSLCEAPEPYFSGGCSQAHRVRASQ